MELSLKGQFKLVPIINPKTGQDIEIGSQEYNTLVYKYGEPNKIKSPKSGKPIGVGKIAYNQLKKEGYTDKQLILGESLQSNKSPQKISSKISSKIYLNQDVMDTIYANIDDIDTLTNICTTNKYMINKCNTKSFWEPILYRNNIELPTIPYNTAKEWITYYVNSNKVNNFFRQRILRLYLNQNMEVIDNVLKDNHIDKIDSYATPPFYRKYTFLYIQKAKKRFLRDKSDDYVIEVHITDEITDYRASFDELKQFIYDLYARDYVVEEDF